MPRTNSKLLILATLALLLAAPLAGAATKEQMYDEMLSLAAQMQSLKPLIHADASAAASFAAAEARYRDISASMGGDDPGHVLRGSRTTSAAAAGRRLNVVPPSPPNCAATTTTFVNNTPTAIIDVSTVTTTINVVGVGPYLWDVDLATNITHTFNADLDITIQSPAGTVVTLTTDNGAGNDNVFNGTVWDDSANPGGQVPYVTNNGLVTDQAYVNLVTATPLVPEEAMAAFAGEDPNGIWTLTVSDDLAGDTGSIDSWSISVTTFPAPPTPTVNPTGTNNTPVAIVDVSTVTSTIDLAGLPTGICDISVTTNITHTFNADLDFTLQSPAGTVVTLSTDNGAGNDNVFNGTVWFDKANPGGQVPYVTNDGLVTDQTYVNLVTATPLVPEEAFGALFGENPNGTWTLTVSDDLAGDVGSIDSWSITVTSCTCAQACTVTCPVDQFQNNDVDQCGAVVNYPAPSGSAGCGPIACLPATGSFFPVGQTAVTCTEQPPPIRQPAGGAAPNCTFNVNVADVQPPVITCPANVTVPPSGGGSTVVNFPPPTVSDNCPGVSAACVPPSGSGFPNGMTLDTCTATDASTNTSSCNFTVNVQQSVIEVPTLSEIGLAALGLALLAAAFVLLRRRRTA